MTDRDRKGKVFSARFSYETKEKIEKIAFMLSEKVGAEVSQRAAVERAINDLYNQLKEEAHHEDQ